MEEIQMPSGIIKELEEEDVCNTNDNAEDTSGNVEDTIEMQMPSGIANNLIGEDIKDTIDKEVKTSLIREETGTKGGYLIDLTKCGVIAPCVMLGLKSMIGTGDKKIPLYLRTQTGIMLLGYGDTDVLNLTLEGYVREVFDKEARLFIYSESNQSYKLVNRGDIRFKKLRL